MYFHRVILCNVGEDYIFYSDLKQARMLILSDYVLASIHTIYTYVTLG